MRRDRPSDRAGIGRLILTALVALMLAGLASGATFYAAEQGWLNELKETNDPDDLDRTAVEGAVHERVNDVRTSSGLERLEYDEALRGIARGHSRDMLRRGYFDHVAPDGEDWTDRYDAAGYDCEVRINESYVIRGGGENIGTISWTGDHLTPANVSRRIVRSWMESPEHRENILRPYWRREGIGVHANETTLFVTQNFC